MSGTLKAKAAKKQPQLAGPGPSVRPGGVMVAPEPKDGGVSATAAKEPETLMGMIASLSPWAEARPRGPRLWGSVCRLAGGARLGAASPVATPRTPPLTRLHPGVACCAGVHARGRGGRRSAVR